MIRRGGLWVLVMVLALGGLPDAGYSTTQRVSPGESLQQQIDRASTGSVILLESGVYPGNLTLDRPLTLRGEEGTRIRGEETGSVITVRADSVMLENLVVTDSGRDRSDDDAGIKVFGDSVTVASVHLRRNLHGIYVQEGNHALLRNNRVEGLAVAPEPSEAGTHHHEVPDERARMGNGIHLWNSTGNRIVGNRVEHARDGIYVSFTTRTEFRKNRVRNSRYGIHYMYSDHNVLVENDLARNVAGAALMFSNNLKVVRNRFHHHRGWRAFGLLLQDVDRSEFWSNRIRGNRMGLSLQNSSANRFESNRFTGNFSGLHLPSNSADNRFTGNRFGLNIRAVELSGKPPRTDWAVDGRGNHWFASPQPDLTGDGVAELPHHEVDLLADHREDFELIDLIADAPGVRLLEWALSRAPVPGTRYVTDPHPLVGREGRQ